MRNQFRHVRKYLAETGIFEIVSRTDEQAVLGDQKPTYYDMARNDFALARNIGKALHADYVMFMERGVVSVTRTVYFRSIILNVESGNKFGVEYDFPRSSRGNREKLKDIVRASYRDLFKSAKEDLLATAMKKSERFMPAPKTEGSTQAVQTTPVPTVPELQPSQSRNLCLQRLPNNVLRENSHLSMRLCRRCPSRPRLEPFRRPIRNQHRRLRCPRKRRKGKRLWSIVGSRNTS